MQLHFSGNSTLEGAINWVEEHGEDEDIDTMLLVGKKDAVRHNDVVRTPLCVLEAAHACTRACAYEYAEC
jgi:uncharacterized UBP type Zn finger protein